LSAGVKSWGPSTVLNRSIFFQEKFIKALYAGLRSIKLPYMNGLLAFNGHILFLTEIYLACLHDQNKSGCFGGPAFFQSIRIFLKTFQIVLISWIKAGPPKKPLLF